MKRSAGILLYRYRGSVLEVLLVHPGGPFWARKEEGAWMIPKGVLGEGEEPMAAARREFREETGQAPPETLIPLEPVQQKGGKWVYAFAGKGDLNPDSLKSNTFELEWPPRSGRRQAFPEIDRAAWYDLPTARRKILAAQAPLLDQLEALDQTQLRSDEE